MILKQVAILIPLLGASALDRTTSVVAGVPEYSGVPVDVYAPLPTLIYNCDNLPAICENVGEYISDNPGSVTWNNGLDFHYDSENAHTKVRRRQSCPSNWQRQLIAATGFSCGAYPGQPNVVPGNLLPLKGSTPQWKAKFVDEIPNALGTGSSGMRWTCDEFPAASWIEGGVNGLVPYTSVYCAPKAVSCSGVTWKRVTKGGTVAYPNTQSEQDWQGRGHALLGGYASKRGGGAPVVMKFHFTTTTLGPLSAATAVQVVMPSYPGNPATTGVTNTKKRSTREEFGRLHCTGAFCDEMRNHGFDFEVPPPQVSFQLFEANPNQTTPESPHATFAVLID